MESKAGEQLNSSDSCTNMKGLLHQHPECGANEQTNYQNVDEIIFSALSTSHQIECTDYRF